MGGDRIKLTGIQVRARHGVFPEEKTNDQLFVIDLDCGLVRDRVSDDLATTVDYGLLARDVSEVVTSDSLDLIETLAERIAARVLNHRAIDRVSVTVHKPEAPMPVSVTDVAVRVTRRQER